MYRAAVGLLLQHENTRTVHKMRIVLHNDSRVNSGDHVADEYTIGGELVIAVRRDPNVSPFCKNLHLA